MQAEGYQAVDLGYRDGDLMREDEDLAKLRGEPRFEDLLDGL